MIASIAGATQSVICLTRLPAAAIAHLSTVEHLRCALVRWEKSVWVVSSAHQVVSVTTVMTGGSGMMIGPARVVMTHIANGKIFMKYVATKVHEEIIMIVVNHQLQLHKDWGKINFNLFKLNQNVEF